ncbi:hypothetical protein NDU88_005630 [Pleurodeles waltl]|uniref:Uncharacterized protein n=1 Tax=Pleurodeles waltl TaxID=8319 RepID=A0AAV7L9Y0_PLEWA|nr:hypothetical protein NDU88_005630 [Pleurodeles waltl]
MRSLGQRDRQQGAWGTGTGSEELGEQGDRQYEELGAEGQAARSLGHRDRQRGAWGTGTGSEELGAQGQAV